MKKTYLLNEIKNIVLDINSWDRIFLIWDLASWKTTFTKHIINDLLQINEDITSPTYTYYNKYEINWVNIYHFDLYRLKNYDEFFAIWWEDILDDENNIVLIEWPDVIKKYYSPTIEINLFKTQNLDEREIEIIKK